MGSSTTNTSSSTVPDWAPQTSALTNAFGQAGTALTQAQGATAPTNYTAAFTPSQLQTFQQMLGYTNGNTTPTSQSATGTAMTGAGTSATEGALTGLSNYNPNTNNNPAAINAAAQSYVNGQNIPAQVAAAMQPAVQTANEVTMPGIEQGAATSGNTNSSRTGIADGLVQQGLAEQDNSLTGSLTGQAYANGLNLASSNANANNANELGALSSAANAGTSAVNSGINAGTSSINNQGTLYSMAQNAGAGQQAANQAVLTNQQQQYQAAVNDPYAALNNYMGIVGSQNWGSSTTGSQTTNPSALSMIAGLLGAGGSAAAGAGKLGWMPFA